MIEASIDPKALSLFPAMGDPNGEQMAYSTEDVLYDIGKLVQKMHKLKGQVVKLEEEKNNE